MTPEVLIDSLENISYKLYKRHQAVRKKPEGVRQWSCLLFLLSSYRFAVIRFVANSGYYDEIGDQSASVSTFGPIFGKGSDYLE